MNQTYFTRGIRTRFSKAFRGFHQEMRPDDLIISLLEQLQDNSVFVSRSDCVEDLVLGCAYPEGEQGYNLARIVALGCGIDAPGLTVNRLCASSMEAVAIASSKISCGWGTLYLVAGVESMSRIPRRGAHFSESDKIKQTCPHAYIANGTTAENVARQFTNIDRQQQEDFAARSHELADAAHQQGLYANQLGPDAGRDELIRVPVNREKIASLAPAFETNGVVTAATSSPLTDGATAGMVTDEATARSCGATSGLEIVDVCVSHVAPEVMGLGPVPATKKVYERNNISSADIAAFEINEAFAIQVLACMQELDIPLEKTNTWGGALALGHPLGASGLRLIMTLHDRLAHAGEPGALGLATLCVGGGQGMSMLCRYVTFD